jgi:hypothetical protein
MQSVIDNDSVFAWWIQDEPDGRRADLETMADAYLYVRTQDPLRPAYTCLCVPGSYELYAPQTDIVSIDVYPIGRSPIVRISETLEHAQDVIPDHVHYFIGQIWPWSNGPARDARAAPLHDLPRAGAWRARFAVVLLPRPELVHPGQQPGAVGGDEARQ